MLGPVIAVRSSANGLELEVHTGADNAGLETYVARQAEITLAEIGVEIFATNGDVISDSVLQASTKSPTDVVLMDRR